VQNISESNISESGIYEIGSLNQLFEYAQNNFENQIIVFDIDKTLITYKDARLRKGVNPLMREMRNEYDLSSDI